MDGGFPAQAAYNAVSVQRIPTHGAIKAGKLASSYHLLIDHIFVTGTLFRFANIASSSMVNYFIWYLLFIFLPHEWHNVWYLCCLNVSVDAPVNMAEICAILIWQGVPQGAELNQFTPAHHRPLYVRHKLAKSLVTEKNEWPSTASDSSVNRVWEHYRNVLSMCGNNFNRKSTACDLFSPTKIIQTAIS